MPVTAKILPNAAVIHVVLSGVIVPGELQTALEEIYAHPDYSPSMPEIGDFQAITKMDVGYDDMQRFTSFFTDFHANNDTPMELFLIDSADVGFSIADMFMSFSMSLDSTVNVHVVRGYPEIFVALNLSFDDLSDFPPNCLQETHLI